MRITHYITESGIFLVNLLTIPLAIYALMQIMGWDWVKAGVACLLLAILPVIGPIINLGLAVTGGYFLYLNGWNNPF